MIMRRHPPNTNQKFKRTGQWVTANNILMTCKTMDSKRWRQSIYSLSSYHFSQSAKTYGKDITRKKIGGVFNISKGVALNFVVLYCIVSSFIRENMACQNASI